MKRKAFQQTCLAHCAFCGVTYSAKRSTASYCSPAHRQRAYRYRKQVLTAAARRKRKKRSKKEANEVVLDVIGWQAHGKV